MEGETRNKMFGLMFYIKSIFQKHSLKHKGVKFNFEPSSHIILEYQFGNVDMRKGRDKRNIEI